MTTQSNHSLPEAVLVAEAVKENRKAQEELYHRYAPKMYALCLRYSGGNTNDAQDFLQEGFIRAFQNLHSFRGEGSFEGWLKKLFVYNCLNQLRRKNRPANVDVEEVVVAEKSLTGYDRIAMKDLMNIINSIPPGYRTVINLYLVEGYSHKEIADMMGIKESTSKSQLARGKEFLQKKIDLHNK
ncbi:MAG: sigma-70 family RNA polymerase sigma factor [Chitinophagaceae bacterium]